MSIIFPMGNSVVNAKRLSFSEVIAMPERLNLVRESVHA